MRFLLLMPLPRDPNAWRECVYPFPDASVCLLLVPEKRRLPFSFRSTSLLPVLLFSFLSAPTSHATLEKATTERLITTSSRSSFCFPLPSYFKSNLSFPERMIFSLLLLQWQRQLDVFSPSPSPFLTHNGLQHCSRSINYISPSFTHSEPRTVLVVLRRREAFAFFPSLILLHSYFALFLFFFFFFLFSNNCVTLFLSFFHPLSSSIPC